ncbi:MAG: hypothetical protein ACI91V_001027, partial [Lentimonas sp.]
LFLRFLKREPPKSQKNPATIANNISKMSPIIQKWVG